MKLTWVGSETWSAAGEAGQAQRDMVSWARFWDARRMRGPTSRRSREICSPSSIHPAALLPPGAPPDPTHQ